MSPMIGQLRLSRDYSPPAGKVRRAICSGNFLCVFELSSSNKGNVWLQDPFKEEPDLDEVDAATIAVWRSTGGSSLQAEEDVP